MSEHEAEKPDLIPIRYRRYIYDVTLAVQPVAVAYGLVTDNMAILWVNVAAAVLGLTLARANTPKGP